MTSHWRQHWADRENARREAEYDKAIRAWQHDLEQICRYHRLSITAGPAINTSRIRLQPGENLWWTTTDAKLIEVPDSVKLFAPEHSAYSPTSAGGTLKPRGTLRDNGFIAITNQRVLFFGALGNREWCFTHLTGVAHGTRETVMRVENRRVLCGLGLGPAPAAAFRFHLTLALAEHHDDREGFTEHLARLLEWQQFHGPRVPSRAGPGEAPRPLWWLLRLVRRLYFGRPGRSVARQLMPALATAVLLVCGLGLAVAPPMDRTAGDWRAPQNGQAPQNDQPPQNSETWPQNESVTIQPPTPKIKPETPASGGPAPVNLCGPRS